MADKIAADNWARYEYARGRGHDDYVRQASRLEGFYLGGIIREDGMLAGGHWDDEDLQVLKEEGRPAYELNEILPACNSAIGYQIHNRMDIAYKPDGNGATQDLADIRSKLVMIIARENNLHYKETQVLADGYIEQRGYFNLRVDFSRNIYGDACVEVLDPRDVIPDPDSKTYDPDGWGDWQLTRWMTLDDVEEWFRHAARVAVEASKPDERDFGDLDQSGERNKFGTTIDATGHQYDAWQRDAGIVRVRVIERQKFKYAMAKVAIHPTGDVQVVEGANEEVLQGLAAKGCVFTKRMQRRVWWTITTKDIVLKELWHPFPFFSLVPFFPYFRRGKTRGMVDNAVGPQQILNKAISQFIHIINTTANSGWEVEQNSLTNMSTSDLESEGASTGIVIEYRKGSDKPTKIPPNPVPQGLQQIMEVAQLGLKEVTVPEAMRGIEGPEISGIAIQSKQFASQQQLAVPMDNLARTRMILARRLDWIIANYYDYERVLRVTDKNPLTGAESMREVKINEFDPATGDYLFDMTVGKYDVAISEVPMQITFENSQFQQALELRKAGVAVPDSVVVRHSNLSDKQEILEQMLNAPTDPEKEAKTKLLEAQARKTVAETVNKNVEASFGAIQTAQTIAAIPATAPLADALLLSAGFEDANPAPIVPQIAAPAPVTGIDPAQAGQPAEIQPVQRQQPLTARQAMGRRNTSPLFPANPEPAANPGVGVDQGIEGGG